MFDAVHLEVSGKCQLSCPYCYVPPAGELSVSEWKEIIRETAPTTRQFTLGGGEPLLYGGTAELVNYIHELGLPVSLTTNGLLADVYGLLLSKVDMVSVSYHGDIGLLNQALSAISGVVKTANVIALKRYWEALPLVIQTCLAYDVGLVVLAPKYCDESEDYTLPFVKEAVAAKGLVMGVDGLCLHDCTAGERFYTISSEGRAMQCSFVRDEWRVGEPARELACLEKGGRYGE